MNYNPSVDVIIPCYNVEHIIKKCVISIINQECNNTINIYLINDGSTDNTLEILNSFSHYDNLHIINNHNNCGRSVTRNNGVKLGNGEIIFFLDSDMTVKKNWVKSHLNIIKDKDVVGVISDYRLPKNKAPNKLDRYLYSQKRGARKFKDKSIINFRNFLFSNTSIKRYVFDSISMFDEKIIAYGGEDTDLGIRLWKKFPNGLRFTSTAPSTHHSSKNIQDFYDSMYIYGNKNLPLLLKKYPNHKNDLGGQYIYSLKGYLIFNPLIRSVVTISNIIVTNYWITRYLVIDSVIRGARSS